MPIGKFLNSVMRSGEIYSGQARSTEFDFHREDDDGLRPRELDIDTGSSNGRLFFSITDPNPEAAKVLDHASACTNRNAMVVTVRQVSFTCLSHGECGS